MKEIKKGIIVTILFCVIVLVIGAALTDWGIHKSWNHFYDTELRNELSGSIDTIYCGSSHLRSGIDPVIVDEITQNASYNLSGNAMTWPGRYYLLKNELERNPVKRVYLEISYNTLSQTPSVEGHIHTLPRFQAFSSRFHYFIHTITRHNFDDYCGSLLSDSVTMLLGDMDRIEGTPCDEFKTNMGYIAVEPEDVSLQGSDIETLHDSETLNASFKSVNMEYFEKIVHLCKENGIELIIINLPVSDNIIWCTENWDEFSQKLQAYCAENALDYYDFNLLKQRYSLFSDSDSFWDTHHLSGIGAREFSAFFADFITKADAGIEYSDWFYSDYRSMKQDSPYAISYQNIVGDLQ